jgi:hypothetical protein
VGDLSVDQYRFALCVLLPSAMLAFASCGADGDSSAPRDASIPPIDSPASDASSDVTLDRTDAGRPTAYRRGASIALSADDRFAVALNRMAATAVVLEVDWKNAPIDAKQTVEFAAGSEPWSVLIAPDGDTFYVLLRGEQRLVRVRNLRTVPQPEKSVETGSEPTGIALSPSGALLYVANFADGTITEVKTEDMTVVRQIDLNAALAQSGVLGNVAARPALAHPRAIVVTDDGDGNDANETIYVSEFFSQQRTDVAPPSKSYEFDVSRQGFVYAVSAGVAAKVELIPISPVSDTGFRDHNGCPTGCFPNQLQAAELHGDRLYVTSTCASPAGPTGMAPPPAALDAGSDPRCSPSEAGETANFRTLLHAAIFVIDTRTNQELPEQRVLLPKQFDDYYRANAIDEHAQLPLSPVDVVFRPGTHEAYVVALGSDGIFQVRYAPDGKLDGVGSGTEGFINLYPVEKAVEGRLPTGIAFANGSPGGYPFALVVNEVTRNVSLLNLDTQSVEVAERIGLNDTDEAAALANGLWAFSTGRTRWSHEGRNWSSCASCHVDGWSDGVTWFFARGPRQTPALDGTYDPVSGQRRIMNWTAVFDEVHDLEGIARDVLGGVGAIVWQTNPAPADSDRITFNGADAGARRTLTAQNGLNGSSASLMPDAAAPAACAVDAGSCTSTLDDWDDIDLLVRKAFRSPNAAKGFATSDVDAGRTLFEAGRCAGCHGGSQWTISQLFYTPDETNNNPASGALRSTAYSLPGSFRAALNPPANNPSRSARLRTPATAKDDSINCVLRDVGTFPAALATPPAGVATPGGALVLEVRQNEAVAQGADGFNSPSLLGLVVGAPYFHAGNARTLEELFAVAFEEHHSAFVTSFLPDDASRETKIRQLVAFLASIDRGMAPVAVPTAALGFDPNLCAAIPPNSVK